MHWEWSALFGSGTQRRKVLKEAIGDVQTPGNPTGWKSLSEHLKRDALVL